MNTLEEIKSALAKRLNVEKLDESAKLKDLGLDSLDIVEMLLQLEEEHDVHFDDVDMSNFETLKDLLDSIEKQIKK